MARDRNAEQRIEDRERRPREQAEFGVGQAEVRLDRLGQDVDDLPVEEIEDIDDQQDPQHRARLRGGARSEEHTSELQSLMRISYAVFCLKKKKKHKKK